MRSFLIFKKQTEYQLVMENFKFLKFFISFKTIKKRKKLNPLKNNNKLSTDINGSPIFHSKIAAELDSFLMIHLVIVLRIA